MLSTRVPHGSKGSYSTAPSRRYRRCVRLVCAPCTAARALGSAAPVRLKVRLCSRGGRYTPLLCCCCVVVVVDVDDDDVDGVGCDLVLQSCRSGPFGEAAADNTRSWLGQSRRRPSSAPRLGCCTLHLSLCRLDVVLHPREHGKCSPLCAPCIATVLCFRLCATYKRRTVSGTEIRGRHGTACRYTSVARISRQVPNLVASVLISILRTSLCPVARSRLRRLRAVVVVAAAPGRVSRMIDE